jgi:8-oxo-dGTP pyrophosphatase MutT (NUDIX family)
LWQGIGQEEEKMPDPWFIVNVEGVVMKGDRFLLTLRSEQESHAPGSLTLPGGKVEQIGISDNILEETLRREIREEAGIEVSERMEYLESKSFVASGDRPVVDVVFLCFWASGEPVPGDPDEVAGVQWMSLAQIRADPRIPPWSRQSLELAGHMTGVTQSTV